LKKNLVLYNTAPEGHLNIPISQAHYFGLPMIFIFGLAGARTQLNSTRLYLTLALFALKLDG